MIQTYYVLRSNKTFQLNAFVSAEDANPNRQNATQFAMHCLIFQGIHVIASREAA